MSVYFLLPFKRAQIIREESIDIELNRFILRFFLDLTASFVNVIERQLARKSSSAFLMAFLKGIKSSFF
jgi:hypothetical protein